MKKAILTLVAVILTSFTVSAEIISEKTKTLDPDASRLAYALSSCPAQLKQLMKGANYIGEVTAIRVRERHERNYETVTEIIKVESGTGGVFRPARKVAELQLTALVHDTRRACDSINCHSYRCELKRVGE